MKKKGIGLDVKAPSKACADKNCPFHGEISTRGRIFSGLVINDKMAKTVSVSWGRKVHVPKYERFEKRRSKVKAHNPECINAKKGDVVKIIETRPLSKTKNFVVIEVLGQKTKKETLKEEAIEAADVLEKQKVKISKDDKESKANMKDVKAEKKRKNNRGEKRTFNR
ncbi:MAG: 30S ribosomal protein S17 [Nanoarchaeota archaeon]|nr:30S ribosomal protein S17 [Nanoarchaeota archaeon]